MTYKNKFKCGTRIWRKLGWAGKVVYNEVYSTMIKNQKMFRYHGGKSYTASILKKQDWEVVCHNAATTAAWAADKAVDRIARNWPHNESR